MSDRWIPVSECPMPEEGEKVSVLLICARDRCPFATAMLRELGVESVAQLRTGRLEWISWNWTHVLPLPPLPKP